MSTCETLPQKGQWLNSCYNAGLGVAILVKLSAKQISEADGAEAAKLLKMIGDFERISDHAVNLLESAEELENKGVAFTASAISELDAISSAVNEILDLALTAFEEDDLKAAFRVEPLEQVF